MTDPAQSPPEAPDLDAIAAQTEAEALQLLEAPALKALQADLRASKEAATDEPLRKALARAVQRIAAEKRRRKGDAPEASGAGTDRAERMRLKEAEKAERQRLREQERAERKAVRQAGKQAAPAGDKPVTGKARARAQTKGQGKAGGRKAA